MFSEDHESMFTMDSSQEQVTKFIACMYWLQNVGSDLDLNFLTHWCYF